MNKVVLSLPEGVNVRNLLESDFLDSFYSRYPNTKLCIITPAARIEEFVNKWKINELISFEPLMPFRPSSAQKRWANIRRRMVSRGWMKLANQIRKKERKIISFEEYYKPILEDAQLVICSHVHLPVEQPIANLSTQLGIPVLGIVNSWDNVFKGIETHTDQACVWNNVNYKEMLEMEGYAPDEVSISGVPAFVPYFQQELIQSREEFCNALNFNPERPIITYASVGQFVPFFEETFILEEILKFRDEIDKANRPQIVCRLHPWSRKELFSKFFEVEDLYFNGYSNYTPTLNWTPSKEEVAFAGNLLRHSDLCISPGSTMSIEAPMFDTPVIVPVYNEKQPEVWNDYHSRFCLAMHFGKLVKGGYANIVTNQKEFRAEFFQYLKYPETNRNVREKLVEDYIGDETDPISRILDQADILVSKHSKIK